MSIGVDAHRVIAPKQDVHLGKPGLSTITQFGNTLLLGTMITTEKSAIFFQAVTDNSDATYRAERCERMNRALEAIVSMSPTVLYYLECFVVIISAGFTFSHGITSEFHALYDLIDGETTSSL